GAQWRPQGVILGLVVGQQELLEQFPPQRGSQQRARVVVPPARDPADLHELSAQRVVHREHHAHVELEIHVSSLTWAWVGAWGAPRARAGRAGAAYSSRVTLSLI